MLHKLAYCYRLRSRNIECVEHGVQLMYVWLVGAASYQMRRSLKSTDRFPTHVLF